MTLLSAEPLAHLRLSTVGLEREGRWLFRNLSWEIPRGTFAAIVGPSGVGKSSLLAVLAGMLPPSEGRISLDSHGKWLLPEHCHTRIGMVFQHLRMTGNASLLSNVLCGRLGRYPFWRTFAGFPKHDREEAMKQMHNLGIAPLAMKWSAEVSGGERQRAAVCRALLQEPEIFLADEPVSNLDAYYSGRVLGLLREQTRTRNATVVCVLHDAALVERFADVALSLNPQDPAGWKLRQIHR